MALVDTFEQSQRSGRQLPGAAPFGLSWWVAIGCSELLFILSRAGAQGAVNIEDAAMWLAGLAPFAIQYLGQRFFSWRSATYLEVWMLSLATFLAMQLSDVAHFIEYPLYLRIDIGFARSLASSCVYVGLGSALLFAASFLFKTTKSNVTASIVAVALACGTLSVALFQPY